MGAELVEDEIGQAEAAEPVEGTAKPLRDADKYGLVWGLASRPGTCELCEVQHGTLLQTPCLDTPHQGYGQRFPSDIREALLWLARSRESGQRSPDR